jgi:hypothetical protein
VHFGDFLPNTYYAKASGNPLRYLHFGVVYVAMFLVGTFPIWIAFLAGGVLAVRRKDWSSYETFLLCLLLVYVAYVLKVGGDPPWAFPFWRHLVHIVPIWIFLAGAAITRFNSQPQRGVGLSFGIGASTAAILLLYVYLPGHMFPGSHTPGFETKAPQHPYFQFIDRFVDQQTITAASLAGQWGWYVPANIIDILGLNDRHIAHYGHYQERGVMDSKTDMLYVMNQHPDVIDAYVSGQKIERGVCPTEQIAARRNMIAGIVHYPNVLDDYYFVSNAPYDVLDRSLLVSGRIAPRAIASGAKLILLKNTVLGNDTCVP